MPPRASFDPFAGRPRLHGARRVGIRPGTELIHPIAATGDRPLRFEVAGLPPGIDVDGDGILRGTAPAGTGTHPLTVRVTNAAGTTERTIELCVCDTLALTPPMGWNSWNVFRDDVSADLIVGVAEAMVATGMRDLGYQYVNINDHWHAGARAPDGTPVADPERFPDGIAAVAGRVHELGLKLGIHSDAAELTCGGCFGGYGYEEIDARTYATWGVDPLKYDYFGARCGWPTSPDPAAGTTPTCCWWATAERGSAPACSSRSRAGASGRSCGTSRVSPTNRPDPT